MLGDRHSKTFCPTTLNVIIDDGTKDGTDKKKKRKQDKYLVGIT